MLPTAKILPDRPHASSPVNPRNPLTWPLSVRILLDATASQIKAAYMLARERLAACSFYSTKIMAERDKAIQEAALLNRENGLLRDRLARVKRGHRPDALPEERFAALQLITLRGWTIAQAAKRLGYHENTLRHWRKEFTQNPDSSPLFRFSGAPNKISSVIRWTVHEIREFCPEPECGTRSIARQLIRQGIKASRSTVQRVLREEKPGLRPAPTKPQPKPEPSAAKPPVTPHHILRPKTINRTWHVDLTVINLFLVQFYVTALLDGFSRKLLAVKLFASTPTSKDMIDLVHAAISAFGKPRFLVADHGCQFRDAFIDAFEPQGIAVIKGKVRTCTFNGKCERFFRTFKLWVRFALCRLNPEAIQRHLDVYRAWYNTARPHSMLGSRTPEEAWSNTKLPEPRSYLARDPVQPRITVKRINFEGDPHLPVIEINLTLPDKAAG